MSLIEGGNSRNNAENNNWTQEKVTFSDIWSFLRELWLEVELSKKLKGEFKSRSNWTIETSRSEIDDLKTWMEWLSKEQIVEKLNWFFEKRAEIKSDTREWLSSVLATAWVWWAVWKVFTEIKDSLNQVKSWETTQDKINWAWNILEKIFDGSLFDKIWDAISWFLWTSFPWLADMLWLEKPAVVQAWDNAKEWAKKVEAWAREKARGVVETSKEALSSKYWIFSSIYFKLFRTSNEASEWGIDKWFEWEVSRLIFENTIFQNTHFNNLQDPSLVSKLYDSINEWWKKVKPEFAEKFSNKEEAIRYIRLVLLSIHWWKEKFTRWEIFTEEKDIEIIRWKEFLIKTFKDIETENPTMNSLFSRLSFFEDFSMFWWGSLDVEWLYEAASWKLSSIYQGWITWIMTLSEEAFNWLKDRLSWPLQNFHDFKEISVAMVSSGPSRRLDNSFQLWDTSISDPLSLKMKEKPDLFKNFLWNENEWFIKFWNDIYNNFIKNWAILPWTSKITRGDISLRDVYGLYLATWWKTNLSDLTPIQKLNLTSWLLFLSWASDVWASAIKMVENITSWDVKIDPEIKNLLLAMWSAVKDMWVNTASVLAKFGWWAMQENPALALWIMLLLVKMPFFTSHHSLASKFKL